MVSNDEIAVKLKKVSQLIKGDFSEKNIGRLNLFARRAMDVWFLIDPISGSVGKGAQLFSDVLDDLLNGLEGATQEEIDHIFTEILERHEFELSELRETVRKLIPKASARYVHGQYSLLGAHGISSITDHSNHSFAMNFIETLHDHEDYFVHCNITGAAWDVSSNCVRIDLPEEYDVTEGKQIKVFLQRMTF